MIDLEKAFGSLRPGKPAVQKDKNAKTGKQNRKGPVPVDEKLWNTILRHSFDRSGAGTEQHYEYVIGDEKYNKISLKNLVSSKLYMKNFIRLQLAKVKLYRLFGSKLEGRPHFVAMLDIKEVLKNSSKTDVILQFQNLNVNLVDIIGTSWEGAVLIPRQLFGKEGRFLYERLSQLCKKHKIDLSKISLNCKFILSLSDREFRTYAKELKKKWS